MCVLDVRFLALCAPAETPEVLVLVVSGGTERDFVPEAAY